MPQYIPPKGAEGDADGSLYPVIPVNRQKKMLSNSSKFKIARQIDKKHCYCLDYCLRAKVKYKRD